MDLPMFKAHVLPLAEILPLPNLLLVEALYLPMHRLSSRCSAGYLERH